MAIQSDKPKTLLDLPPPTEFVGDPLETQKTGKADRQEFFLPFTGFAWFYPEEVRVINHPAFQRLARVNQLGQAFYVYRGATHKRLEHVLGVVALTQRMISAISFNSEKAASTKRRGGGFLQSAPLSESEERFVRLAALLHDIGHIAAGHTIEDELELIGKHDADERLTLVFDKDNWSEFLDLGKEPLGRLVNRLYRKYLPASLREVEPIDIVRLLIRKRPDSDDGFEKRAKDS